MSLPIGIATLHYGFNEGALLQAMALAKGIEKAVPESNVEIIDQRYPGKLNVYGKAETGRSQALQKAIDDWLPVTKKRMQEANSNRLFDRLRGKYSGLVVGSDVVWTLKYQRRFRRFFGRGILPHQPDPFFPAFPNLYWPGADLRIPRFAYAASVGLLDIEEVPGGHRRQMAQRLSSFELLSVRDEKTLEFLERLDKGLAARTELMPDPTLGFNLVDDTDDDGLKAKLEAAGVDFSRPRIGVIAPDLPALEKMADRLRGQGCQVIGITTRNGFSDANLFDQPFHPLEWGRLFHFMDVCVLERMHGMIFSLLNETPFVALDQYRTEHNSDTKVSSLLRRFGLNDHLVPRSSANGDELAERVKDLRENKWDWNVIRERRAECEAAAQDFLQRMGNHLN